MTRPANLKAYAQLIVEDERFGQLEKAIEEELFNRWCEELNPDKRDIIHNEHLGFKLFFSKLKALAVNFNLGDKK